MCSALSPDRYPRPQRAFVYHERDGPRAGSLACHGRPGGAGQAGERAFRGPSPRLTSPPSLHSRAWFLNLVCLVPAPLLLRLLDTSGQTVSASGIGRPRRLLGGLDGPALGCDWRPCPCWVVLPAAGPPAPLKVIWRTRQPSRGLGGRPEPWLWPDPAEEG